MTPTPEQLNSVANWLEQQAAHSELRDAQQGLKTEVDRLLKEFPALRAIWKEAEAREYQDCNDLQVRFWGTARQLLEPDPERRERIGQKLYAVIEASRAALGKHTNGG
jgi:hypothetical protein